MTGLKSPIAQRLRPFYKYLALAACIHHPLIHCSMPLFIQNPRQSRFHIRPPIATWRRVTSPGRWRWPVVRRRSRVILVPQQPPTSQQLILPTTARNPNKTKRIRCTTRPVHRAFRLLSNIEQWFKFVYCIILDCVCMSIAEDWYFCDFECLVLRRTVSGLRRVGKSIIFFWCVLVRGWNTIKNGKKIYGAKEGYPQGVPVKVWKI